MPPLGHRRAPASHGRPVYATVALWDFVDDVASRRGMSRSELVVRAIDAYLHGMGEHPPEPVIPRSEVRR